MFSELWIYFTDKTKSNTNINIRDNSDYLKYKYLIALDKMLTQGYN